MLRRLVTLSSPPALAVALILDGYGQMSGHWLSLLRPVIVSAAVATVLTLVLLAITRRMTLASAVGVAVVCFLFGQQGLFAIALLGIATALAWMWWLCVSRRPQPSVSPIVVGLPVIALLAVVLASRIADGSLALGDPVGLPRTAVPPTSSGGTNVYVLLLDGYPRADDLEAEWGFDNGRFLSELASLDFDVDPDSRSPFQETSLTLAASMLQDTRPLRQWRPSDFQAEVQMRRDVRRQYLGNTPVMDRYRSADYRLVYIASPVAHTDWFGWDVRLDSGNVTDVETLLIQRSPLRFVLGDWVMDQHRARLDASLVAWADQGSVGGRQVVFAHVMAPHPPFLYGPHGAERSPLPCWFSLECNIYHHRAVDLDISVSDYDQLLLPHLQELNKKVLGAIRELVAIDPQAAIVVFSDHGARYSESRSEEWYHSLFAARLPSDLRMTDLRAAGLFATILRALDGRP